LRRSVHTGVATGVINDLTHTRSAIYVTITSSAETHRVMRIIDY